MKRSPKPVPNAPSASLADQAYATLETLLVTLALEPGAVVSEQELCARTGYGRTPVREAIQRLSSLGLLRVLPRRGLVVAPIDGVEHLGVLETRRALDRLLASLAARRASPEQRSALKACAEAMAKAAARSDLPAYLREDAACDAVLEAACRNPSAVKASEPLHIHCRRFWFRHHHEGDLGRAAALHGALMKAVARGDEAGAAAASDALMDHLERFARRALDLD
jgi:DNA-binding GntR family transcriptional regulator